MTSPPASPTRAAILSSARRLLVSRGFQDLALDDVARGAGVAKGTLFLHFRDKDALFSAVFAGLVDRLGEDLDALAGRGLRGRPLLLAVVRTVLGHLDRHRDFISQFGTGRFPGCRGSSCERLMGRLARNMRRVVGLLKGCAAGGLFPPRRLERSAAALFGLCRSSVVYGLITGRRRSAESRAAEIVELFLYGVRGRR